MVSNKVQDLTRDNAAWLLGFNDAMIAMYALRDMGVVPAMESIQTDGYKKSLQTCAQIMSRGAFNPVDVWEMNKYIESLEKLIRKKSEKI